MLKLFVDKMFLSEPSTRTHFTELVNFVEVWDRWLGKSLPAEVLKRLDYGERRLSLFYEDLEQHFERLRAQLARG